MKKKLLSLEIFALRFGFSEEELSYGIAFINDEKFPVILVKDKPVFINIREDVLYPTEIPNIEITFSECSLTENVDECIFEAPEAKIALNFEEVEKFYAGKYCTEATRKYIIGH